MSRFSWSWMYAVTYILILIPFIGQYLPNSFIKPDAIYDDAYIETIVIFMIVRIPNLFIYFSTAKKDGYIKAFLLIVKIEFIAFLFGIGLFIFLCFSLRF